MTAFFRLGAVLRESQLEEVCWIKPGRYLYTLKADVGFISTAIWGARRRGPSRPFTACSHERKARDMGKVVIRRLRKFPSVCSL